MNYRIVEDVNELKLDDIVRLLRTTYWAEKRSVEKIEKSVKNSKCYGLYLDGVDSLVGFARVIRGFDEHHIIEAGFKSLGLALKGAIVKRGSELSTKDKVKVK